MPPRRPAQPPPNPFPRLRGRGALLGLAVGDALGVHLENRPLVAAAFPNMMDGPHRNVRGGGPFELRRGQVTAVPQMACCIAQGLREAAGYSAEDTMRRYLRWRNHAAAVGDYTAEVLQEMAESGLPRLTAGRRVWLRHFRRTADNGSLARTAPLGVFFAGNRDARIQASLEDSAITHYDPRCQLACATLNGSIACAINAGEKLRPDDLITAARSEMAVAASVLGRMMPEHVLQVQEASDLLKADLEAAQKDDPLLYGPELHMHRQKDDVRVAFRLAYWELLHASGFEVGLVDVINRGGDTVANGAVAGALLGAFHGEDAIPPDWQQPVLAALASPMLGPLATVYHPRNLLLLAPE
jgi:ADP-ribosylglycohydrolase